MVRGTGGVTILFCAEKFPRQAATIASFSGLVALLRFPIAEIEPEQEDSLREGPGPRSPRRARPPRRRRSSSASNQIGSGATRAINKEPSSPLNLGISVPSNQLSLPPLSHWQPIDIEKGLQLSNEVEDELEAMTYIYPPNQPGTTPPSCEVLRTEFDEVYMLVRSMKGDDHSAICLRVTLGISYPEAAPTVALESAQGVKAPAMLLRRCRDFLLSDEVAGSPALFVLSEHLAESLANQ